MFAANLVTPRLRRSREQAPRGDAVPGFYLLRCIPGIGRVVRLPPGRSPLEDVVLALSSRVAFCRLLLCLPGVRFGGGMLSPARPSIPFCPAPLFFSRPFTEEIGFLPPFLLLRTGDVDFFMCIGVLPGVEHHRREGHWRRGEILYLFEVEMELAEYFRRQRAHVTFGAARV